jgi:DNA-directed RNA polymerase specialized sigma24 family protein
MIQFNRRKAAKRFNNFDDVQMPLVSREPDPADACLSREKRHHVRQMLTALGKTQSERSYQVLYHRSINDLNAKGIANLLQLTPEQVRARYHRMKQKARKFLRSQFGESSYRG